MDDVRALVSSCSASAAVRCWGCLALPVLSAQGWCRRPSKRSTPKGPRQSRRRQRPATPRRTGCALLGTAPFPALRKQFADRWNDCPACCHWRSSLHLWQRNAGGVRQVPRDQIRGSRPSAAARFSSRAMSSASLLLRPTKSLPSVAAGKDVKVSTIVHLPRGS
jgi:hypothetical protein